MSCVLTTAPTEPFSLNLFAGRLGYIPETASRHTNEKPSAATWLMMGGYLPTYTLCYREEKSRYLGIWHVVTDECYVSLEVDGAP